MKRLLVCISLMAIILSMCACSAKNEQVISVEDIREVCELATLDLCYNHVAKIHKEADNIFQRDRTVWIEFEGHVQIGIDMKDVVIEINENVVNVQMPDAKILSNNYSFDNCRVISSQDGLIFTNKISVEEQEAAVAEGEKAMLNDITNNKTEMLNYKKLH